MAIKDLLPWKQDEKIPVRQAQDDEHSVPPLHRDMNRLVDFMAAPFGLTPFGDWASGSTRFSPSMDVTETDKKYEVTAELAGMQPKDISIMVDRNVLVISGEKRHELEEKECRYHRLERSFGCFRRSIPLPREIDRDKIESSFGNGVLTVTLPKTRREREKATRIHVKSGP